MLTPLSAESYQNMELNAGIFVVGFDYKQYKTAAAIKAALKTLIDSHDTKLLGATRGGGTFTVTKETRNIEADGARAAFKGSTIVDSVDAYISGTALEITPENVQRVFASGEVTDDEGGKMHTIKMRTFLQDSDYIESLCWVGDKADGGFVLIALDNALNNGDVNFTFSDKNEMTMPFEFHAYHDDVLGGEYAPFEIVLLDAEE